MAQPQSFSERGSCLSVAILRHTKQRPGDCGSSRPPFTEKASDPGHSGHCHHMSVSAPDWVVGEGGEEAWTPHQRIGHRLPSPSSSTSLARQRRLVDVSKATLSQDMAEALGETSSHLSLSFSVWELKKTFLGPPDAECSEHCGPDTHQRF